MKNILFLEKNDYSEKALADYQKIGGLVFFENLSKEQKLKALAAANILVVRLAHKIDGDWLEKMPNLEMVVSPTTGLNHLDLAGLRQRKVKVISLRGRTSFLKNISATAELTFGLILSLVRNIPWAYADVTEGNWNREAWVGQQLRGKTLGLLGVGRLGKIVAKYGRAFGLRVVGADPYVSEKSMRRYGIVKISAETLFKVSDVISVHVSFSPETENLVSANLISLMKKSAYFINTSRGEIVDEKALLRALEDKNIAGAALDVLAGEAGLAEVGKNKLVSYSKKNKNLIIVPHIGGAAVEAMRSTEEFIASLVLKHYSYE
jgi:D-3-phosphoglycerate dehydrogenase